MKKTSLRRDQQGFSPHVLMLIAVLVVIGAVGFYVFKQADKTQQTLDTVNNSSVISPSPSTGATEETKTKTIELADKKVTFTLPDTWQVKADALYDQVAAGPDGFNLNLDVVEGDEEIPNACVECGPFSSLDTVAFGDETLHLVAVVSDDKVSTVYLSTVTDRVAPATITGTDHKLFASVTFMTASGPEGVSTTDEKLIAALDVLKSAAYAN